MRPKGVFTSFDKLISLDLTHTKDIQVALSVSGWPAFTLIPSRLAACDCSICKMSMEAADNSSLILMASTLYGGFTNVQNAMRQGKFDYTRAIHERLADLRGIPFDSGDYKSALLYYLKTSALSSEPLTADCDHFVNAMPIQHPHVYHDYLTRPVVDIGEAGLLALTSPYAIAYPESCEMQDELWIKARRRSRSVVALSQRPVDQTTIEADNLVRLPPVDQNNVSVEHAHSQGAARILDFQGWVMTRDSCGIKKDKVTRQKIKRMSLREKRLRILDLISEEDMDDHTLESVLEFLESIAPDTESQG